MANTAPVEFNQILGEEGSFPCRRVLVKEWKNERRVDIREWEGNDEKSVPTKKGISLTTSEWDNLKKHSEEIDNQIRAICTENAQIESKFDLGGLKFVSLDSAQAFIDVRAYWYPSQQDQPDYTPLSDEKPVPTKRGIALRPEEWDSLVMLVTEIDNAIRRGAKKTVAVGWQKYARKQ